MAATNNLIGYAASSSLTLTGMGALASDANFLSGFAIAAIDNSSNKYLDYLISGYIKVHASNAPTANTYIQLWAVPELDDSTWPSPFDGTLAARAFTYAGQRDASAVQINAALVTNVANITYPFGKRSLAELFGGSCPRKTQLWVVHNTGQNLAADGNHALYVQGVYSSSGN